MHRSGDFDDFTDAVTSLLDARDHQGALEVISTAWPAVVSTHGRQLRELIECLPFDDWNGDPWIVAAIGASYRSLESPSRSAALPYFRTAEAQLDVAGSPCPSVIAGVRTHHSAALRSLGQHRAAEVKARSAWDLLESDVGLPTTKRVTAQTKASMQLGMIAIHAGDYDQARRRLRLALGLSDHHLSRSELVECLSGLAFLEYAAGDFDDALELVDRAAAAAAGTSLFESQFGVLAIITRLLVCVERNQVDDALDAAERVTTIAARTEWQPLGCYATAAISIIRGTHIEGLDHVRRGMQAVRSWDSPGVVHLLFAAMRGALLMHLGETEAAIEIVQSLTPTFNHANCPARFIASIQFKAGDAAGCLDALRDCEALGDSHSGRTVIDVLLLKAAANYELGNTVIADIAFDRALLAASRSGVRTPFTLIPGLTMQRMLGRAADRNLPAEVHTLLDDLRAGQGSPQLGALEPLSEREKDIAQHLYLDKTVSQIAQELFISTNTVKTHVRSIYRKLDTTNRKDAMRRVRELGLHLEITPL